MNLKIKILLMASALFLGGCFSGLKRLEVVDFTNKRVTDLVLTKKVTGKKNFLFFSTTKTGIFLEGNIQGVVTDYYENPIEGVTVKAVAKAKGEESVFSLESFEETEKMASSFVNLSFTPGISDSQGQYKIRFSLPVVDGKVDVEGNLIYNPGWEQQKINLGKTYEPQIKQSPFRLYYDMDSGFLAFAEGVRPVIVQPVGKGEGKLKKLPGSEAPGGVQTKTTAPAPAQGEGVEDLFKGFNFGE